MPHYSHKDQDFFPLGTQIFTGSTWMSHKPQTHWSQTKYQFPTPIKCPLPLHFPERLAEGSDRQSHKSNLSYTFYCCSWWRVPHRPDLSLWCLWHSFSAPFWVSFCPFVLLSSMVVLGFQVSALFSVLSIYPSLFFLLAIMWDLSSLTRDQTCVPCSRSTES